MIENLIPSTQTPDLKLCLLGEPSFSLAGQPLPESAGARARELLAYLAVFPGHPHRRDRLMEAIWPDKDLERASASLRRALFLLRQSLNDASDELLSVSDTAIQLQRDGVECDLWKIEAAISNAATSVVDSAHVVAGLYAGDLMGTAAPDWAFLRREQLRRDAVAIVSAGAAAALDQRLDDRVAELAGAWLRIEPLDERAHLILMQQYARNGDQAGVIHQYELCRSMYAKSRRGVPVGLEDAFLRLCEQASTRSLSVLTPGPIEAGNDPTSSNIDSRARADASETGPPSATARYAAPQEGTGNARRLQSRRWGVRAAAAVALVAITGATAAGWQRVELSSGNVQEIIHEYQFATAMEQMPIESGNSTAVDRWFRDNIPYSVDQTPSSALDFQLQGAGACDLDGHVAATAIYRGPDDSAVAVFRLPSGELTLPAGRLIGQPDPAALRGLNQNGHSILFWNRGGLTYAVVGRMELAELEPIARLLAGS